jgi:hypothetical protein
MHCVRVCVCVCGASINPIGSFEYQVQVNMQLTQSVRLGVQRPFHYLGYMTKTY